MSLNYKIKTFSLVLTIVAVHIPRTFHAVTKIKKLSPLQNIIHRKSNILNRES